MARSLLSKPCCCLIIQQVKCFCLNIPVDILLTLSTVDHVWLLSDNFCTTTKVWEGKTEAQNVWFNAVEKNWNIVVGMIFIFSVKREGDYTYSKVGKLINTLISSVFFFGLFCHYFIVVISLTFIAGFLSCFLKFTMIKLSVN